MRPEPPSLSEGQADLLGKSLALGFDQVCAASESMLDPNGIQAQLLVNNGQACTCAPLGSKWIHLGSKWDLYKPFCM